MAAFDFVTNAVKAATGSSSTGLKDFLSNFSANGGEWVKQIDPLNTFELTFKFHPNKSDIGEEAEKKSAIAKIGESLLNTGIDKLKNAANNLTGGLASNLMERDNTVKKKRKEHASDGHKLSFVKFLVEGQTLKFEDAVQYVLNLGLYCQDITIPSISVPDTGTVTNSIAILPTNGTIVTPDSNKIVLNILNTKLPLVERLFYPWMKEVDLPYWSYESQPYTTADVTVDFSKHADVKYHFFGCRPVTFNTLQASQQNFEVKRQVTLMFDFMSIDSKLRNMESAGSKLGSAAMSMLGSGAKMIKL